MCPKIWPFQKSKLDSHNRWSSLKHSLTNTCTLDVGFNLEGFKLGFTCCSYTKLNYGNFGIKRDTTIDEVKLSVDGRIQGLSSRECGDYSSKSHCNLIFCMREENIFATYVINWLKLLFFFHLFIWACIPTRGKTIH